MAIRKPLTWMRGKLATSRKQFITNSVFLIGNEPFTYIQCTYITICSSLTPPPSHSQIFWGHPLSSFYASLGLRHWVFPVYCNEQFHNIMRLHEPRTSTLWGDRSFTAAAARVWNQLPLAIKLSSSITTFKKNLKSHLYKQAYSHNPQS